MRSRISAAFVAVALSSALPAWAFDGLSFSVAGGGDLEQELRNSSLLVQAAREDVTDTAELLAAARAEYGRLIGALYGNGRYGGVITITVDGREAAEISPLAQLNGISRIDVQVDPGPRYLFSQTEIVPLAPRTELPDAFRRGKLAESGVIRDATGVAISAWRDVGYAKAEVRDQRIAARHEENRLSAEVDIDTGPLVRFGNLRFTGSEDVREERLRAIAGFPSGRIFDPDELDNVTRRLRNTQVFSAVALTEAEKVGPGQTLDVTAALTAFPPRRIGFGAEISTVEGLTLSGFWLHRNLFGGAERFRVDGEVSGIGGGTGGTDYSLGARFERPATFAPENTAFVDFGIERLDEQTYVSNTAALSFGIMRYVNEELEISYGLGLRYSNAEDNTGNTTDYAMFVLPLTATYDSRDAPLDATEGFYLDASVTPFLGLNDNTGDGVRATYDARSYLSFGDDDRVTLAGRLQGGSIFNAALTEVAPDYRFYSGGGGIVRGQAYQSLGVTLPGGVNSGGASYVAISAEARVGVTEKIGVVAFYDYGVVGFESFPGSNSDSHAGAGLGVRYDTPIGPVRLDVAAPVSGGGDGFDLYVGIGQAF